jgi:cation diffusion facilitator CzcD-associated flavoprotein CzcO
MYAGASVLTDYWEILVGAGHIGLTIAARLRQIGVNALVIEQHARVGDEWRKRYPSLYLHTPKRHHACESGIFSLTEECVLTFHYKVLYQPYPSTWPEFTPRDKLAEWLEQYPVSNDLVVWTSSKIETRPSYDKETGTWDIVVNKNGTPISLNPKHLVWATGTFGAKNIPAVPGLGSFKGPLLHGIDYKGGELFADKKVVVVGSANTAADICQDLYVQGAKSVTMVQRSKTCLVSSKLFGTMFDMLYPEGTPTEVCDLKYTTTPIPLLREMGKMMVPWMNEFDKEMLDGVKKRGFQVWNGHDDSGQLILAFERAGGSSIPSCAYLVSALF